MSDPRQKDFDERHTKLPTVQALSKREYFAAMAMSGILSHPAIYMGQDPKTLAKEAIECADELTKQLSQ